MRLLQKVIIYLCFPALFFIVGCSSSKSSITPIMPDKPDQEINQVSSEGIVTLMSGSFEIDKENGLVNLYEDHNSQVNLNITSLLNSGCPGGCFKFRITGINGTVLTIELEITNPTSILVWDVRMIYLNLHGKTVLNPDSYTDLLTGGLVKPFTAFAKENQWRDFPVGPNVKDTEILLLDYPAGASPLVDFIIVASLPDNTQEPYEIVDMDIDGIITTEGGTAELSMYVHDHQDDISLVIADTRFLTGGYTFLIADDPLNQFLYHATISNTVGTPGGSYDIWVRADSPNGHNAHTYNYITLNVIYQECTGQVHEYVGTYNVSGVDFFVGDQINNKDIAYIEVGPYAGKVIYAYDCGAYGMIDPVTEDQEMIIFFNDGAGGTICNSEILDACPVSGRIYQCGGNGSKEARIFAPDGEMIGTWYDDDAKIAAVEFDDNGDLWAMMIIESPEIDPEFHLRHYTYLDNYPFYQTPAVHDTNFETTFPPDNWWGCQDLALDFERDVMYLFMTLWPEGDYCIAAYDVSTGYAEELYSRDDVFTKRLCTPSVEYGYGMQADIEIDHSVKEYCSIVVGGITQYDYAFHYELIRLDGDLNVIDFDDSYPYSAQYHPLPHTFTIVQGGTHPIIGVGEMADPLTQNKFIYFESPDW